MRRKWLALCIGVLCFGMFANGMLADDSNVMNWPQFRGADATGVSKNTGLPDKWSATENVEWKVEIAGRGWGSPVVWGNSIFVSSDRKSVV